MRIISWNVNGLRAILKKNFLGWLEKENPEILCLQEIKSQPNQLPADITQPKRYFPFINSALRPGYSGLLCYSQSKPVKTEMSLGLERFDQEGRFLKINFKNFSLINIYLPHGGRGKENLSYKLEVYNRFIKYLEKLKDQKIILVGDFNIAHREIDLARPKQNKNNIMFTQDERKQIDKIIDLGFIDTFRKFHPESDRYTWWPYYANARKRNLGWRIDYIFVSRKLIPNLSKAFILPEVLGSDHCPIGIEVSF